jgi:predicted ABC-type ATPase
VETVLSSQKFFPVINAAKANAFRTRLVYCVLPSVGLAIARVELRVSEGGHDVPEAKIRRRWNSSLDNFVRLVAIVDEVVLLNNAGENPVEIGYKNLNGKLELVEAVSVPDLSRRLSRAKGS